MANEVRSDLVSVISAERLWFERGEKMFRDGKKSPPKPSEDSTGNEPASLLWIGFRVALGIDHMNRCAVARKLHMPEPEFREP